MTHSLRVLTVWCLAVLAAPWAHAQPAQRCGGADVLESVPSEDRAFLRALCEMSPERARQWRRRRGDEVLRLRKLITRLVARSDAEAVALSRLLPAAVFEPKRSLVTCQDAAARKRLDEEMRALLTPLSERERATNPFQRAPPVFLLPEGRSSKEQALPEGDTEERIPASDSATAPGRVPFLIAAPDGLEVRLMLAGQDAGALQILPAEVAAKGGNEELKLDGYRLHLWSVPYNVLFSVIIEQKRRADGTPHPSFPTVYRDTARAAFTHFGTAPRADCIDIQVKSELPLSFFLDGVAIEVSRQDDLWSDTLWVPTDEHADRVREHRLTITTVEDGAQRVMINRSIELDAKQSRRCEPAHFDLTTKPSSNTLGLLSASADACVDAGIDTPKLLAYLTAYVNASGRRMEDLRSWSAANQYIADLKQAVSAASGESASVGAPRGRLDSVTNLSDGTEELLRRGFETLLIVDLRCSRRLDAGWDYSFVAREVNLEAIRKRSRDPITGIEISGIQNTEIELITDRRELGPRIDETMARLLKEPSVMLLPLPEVAPFSSPIRGKVEAQVPPTKNDAQHYVTLSLLPLTTQQQSEICTNVERIHELRARRAVEDLRRLKGWHEGLSLPVAADGKLHAFPLSVEPIRPQPYLVRATLYQTGEVSKLPLGQTAEVSKLPLAAVPADAEVQAESYRCTDLTRIGVEPWIQIGGWFHTTTALGARDESSVSFNLMVGVDWQQAAQWLSLGVGLGYSRTTRRGDAPPVWDGLSMPERFEDDGALPYRIEENAAYIVINAQAKSSFCELFGLCKQLTRRMLFTGRLMLLPGLHVLDKSHRNLAVVPTFRGQENEAFVSVGGFGELGSGVEISRRLAFHIRFGLGSYRLPDLWLSADEANVYPGLIWSTSVGAAWDF